MNIERPASCPPEGQFEAFDAGWNAHEVGISRESTRVLAANPRWAVLAWDIRDKIASRIDNKEEELDTPTTTRGDVRRAIKEAHHLASRYAAKTGARRDKKREDKLWSILKEMEHDAAN